MNNPKVKLLLLVTLLAALGAVISAFAAGSHFHIGLNNGAFNFDFKLGAGESTAAAILGFIALAAGIAGVWLYVSQGGSRGGGEAASDAGAAGSSGFTDFAGALRRLTKSRVDVWVGGVCGGLGEHTPLPAWVWRFAFLLLLCCYGTGVLLYVLLWICLPLPLMRVERPATPSSAAVRAAE